MPDRFLHPDLASDRLTRPAASFGGGRPVLVTGAAGFLGRHLVSALVARGIRVSALVRRPEQRDELTRMGAAPVVGDLLDTAAVPALVSGVRGVFHLAGRLFVPGTPAAAYERLHVAATRELLRACAAGPDLEFVVLCSTTGVHGPTGVLPAREDDPGRPSNAYERSKADAERAATAIAQEAGLPLTIARPALVYGPGDRHLLGLFRAIRGGYYRVIGSGAARVHPIFIDDLIDGLLAAACRGRRGGRTYQLAGPRAVTMRELSEAIAGALGRPLPPWRIPRAAAWAAGAACEALPIPRRLLPLTRSRVRFMTEDRVYDGTRARDEIGFVPGVDLEEGLARTVAWYRKHAWL